MVAIYSFTVPGADRYDLPFAAFIYLLIKVVYAVAPN